MYCEKCGQTKSRSFKRFVVVVLIFANLISLFSCGGSKSGYEDAIEQLIDYSCYYNVKHEDILTMAPLAYWKKMADNYADGDINALISMKEEYANTLKEKRSESLKTKKVSYQVNYLTKLSVKECQEVEEKLESTYILNFSGIAEAYSFTLELTITTDGNQKQETLSVIAVNTDDNWYLAFDNKRIEWAVDAIIMSDY